MRGNTKKIFALLLKAWNKISLCDLTDKIYNNHPLTFEREIIRLWDSRIPPYSIPNRNLIFTNIKAIFLIIGIAIRDLN